MKFSADVFWMEFADELLKSGQVDIFGQPVTWNADRTRHLGLEVEGAATFADAFSVSGNFTLSRNRLVRYSVIDNGAAVSLDHNPIAGFPDMLGNIRLTYQRPLLTVSALVRYVGSFYTDNFKNEDNRNDACTVCDAQLLCSLPAIGGVEVTVRGEVHNVFDTLYFASGEGNKFFPGAERNYVFGLTLHL